MILKKSLRIKTKMLKGQAVLEYFILLAIICTFGLISVSTFLPRVRRAIQGTSPTDGYFQKAADQITRADVY
jgi:hypothetical protein